MPRRVIKKLPSVGRRPNIDRFDPNAIDADGDGKIQDATRFERPAMPKKPKASRISGAVGRVRTPEIEERDKRIVQRWKNGEKRQQIAEAEGASIQAVGWALNQARKRGDITEPRRSTPPYTRNAPASKLIPNSGPSIDVADKEVIDAYDAGKSVVDIAKERNVKPGDILKTLVKYRLPDDDGRMTIPRPKQNVTNRTNNRITGAMARLAPEKDAEIEKYLKENPDKSNNYVAKKFNVSLNLIKNRREALGLPPSTWLLSDQEKQKIDEAIKNNPELSLRMLSRMTGMSTTAIKSRQKALGIKPSKQDNYYLVRIPAEKIEAIDKDIRNNPSQFTAEIARTHGVSEKIIKARREKLGLPSPVTGANALSPETRKAVEDDIRNNPEMPLQEIAERNGVSRSFVQGRRDAIRNMPRPTRKEKERQIGQRTARNQIEESVKDEVVNAYLESDITIPELAEKLRISENSILNILKERGVSNKRGSGARAKNRNETSRRANRRSKFPSTNTVDTPEKSEVVDTPGAISGSMANNNPRAGRRIKTETQVAKLDGTKASVKVKYGDIDFDFEVDTGSYSEWVDAYDLWVGWYGNYSMRVASAALMNEPLPKTFGYQGDDEGTHEHDLLGSGEIVNPARSEISGAKEAVQAAFTALSYINSGNETNTRPIYRGLTNVTSGEEIINLAAGEIITMPLSAFTTDRGTATYYATRGDEEIPNVIIEIMPGAKIANAAGEQYQHQFYSEGEWVTDVTEQVTQGKFKFVRMSTSYVADRGQTKKIKTVTLEQIETFNPSNGKFEKFVGSKPTISGSIGSPSQKENTRRLGEIREIVRGLMPADMQTLRDRGVDNYVKRNPVFIKRLAAINSGNDWQDSPDAINPDGTKMTKAQYIAMVNIEQRLQAQEYISKKLNNYAPSFNPWHLQQLQNNVETMYLSSPEMQILADVYGYPQFAIFRSQESLDKNSVAKYITNEEADKTGLAALGVTLMAAGISGIMPYSDDAFIQKGEKIVDALANTKRRVGGAWGVSPEILIDRFGDDPFEMITGSTDALLNIVQQNSPKPWVIDQGHPLSTVRHEASHAIHAGALAKAALDMESNPTQEVKDAHSLLSLFNKKDWQTAALVDRLFVQMMMNSSISEYADTGPSEWLAETLSAALSPSKKTRALIGFNHRAILARAFPELYEYLVEKDWP